jgi:hypothetical protein
MNTVAEDAALVRGGDAPGVGVRDALNFDVSPAGRLVLRPGFARVTSQPFRCLWQSPLHGDVFGALGEDWVRIDSLSWTYQTLASVGAGEVFHEVLNNRVVCAGENGIFVFDGESARRLTLETPPPPVLAEAANGSLSAGTYGAAIAWTRGKLESPLSEASFMTVGEGADLEIAFPPCLDTTVDGARLYLTRANGGEFLLAGSYPLSAIVPVSLLPPLGRAAPFRFMAPMPTGSFPKLWNGRLFVARANVLYWSEALAYHVHDPRHGFLPLPQRIRFVAPVDAGLWIGQADRVCFLRGSRPDEFSVENKAARPPVAGSAIGVPSEVLGEIAQGGANCAVWLAGNGYVIGTAGGQIVEAHAGALAGISGQGGVSALAGRRVLTVVR